MNETSEVADATKPTRARMISFLRKHFRYYTMSSWNRVTKLCTEREGAQSGSYKGTGISCV